MSSDAQQQEQASQYHDEIDLKDIIAPLWKAKWWIVLWGLVFAALVAVYQLGGVALDRSQQMQAQIHFDFKGAEDGVYPNGTKFSPLEMLSGAVLGQVYRDLNTDAFSYQELTQALVVTPNFDGADRLESLVTKLVAKDKGLNTQEYSDAVGEYTQALTSFSKTYVTLTLDMALVNGNQQLATRILNQVPSTWAKQALEDRGVLVTNLASMADLNRSAISEELLVKVNVLADTQLLLTDYIDQLIENTDNLTIKDPATGQSLADLQHNLQLEDKYRIAILRELVVKHGIGVNNADWYNGFRAARLGKLEREKASLERMVGVYEQAISQFNQQQQQMTAGNANPQDTGSATVYAPQYGEDVINTLLQLGSKMADPEYRKELLKEKIELSTQLQQIITEIEFYAAETTQQDGKREIGAQEIAGLIDESFDALQGINQALSNITQIANESLLDDKGQLYSMVGEIKAKNSSNLSMNSLLKIILAAIAGGMLATITVLLRRVLLK